jgi:hypothetical protein
LNFFGFGIRDRQEEERNPKVEEESKIKGENLQKYEKTIDYKFYKDKN